MGTKGQAQLGTTDWELQDEFEFSSILKCDLGKAIYYPNHIPPR